MSAEMTDDDIVRLARIASASNNYSGGRWISAEFSRDDLVGFARAVIASLPSERPEAEDAWQPISTAPQGANGVAFMHLAWGAEGDESTGSGMRIGDSFFAVGVFYCLGQTKKYEFRELEVKPTHWMRLPALAASQGAKE